MIVQDAGPYIPYVFSHLWQRGVEELAGLGLTPEQGKEIAMQRTLQGESWAFVAENPVCVGGVIDGCTWFQSTDEFDKYHVEITHALTEISSKGDYTIYSQLIHPKTEKWFNRMGFVRDDWQGSTPTGRPVYRFRRSKNV